MCGEQAVVPMFTDHLPDCHSTTWFVGSNPKTLNLIFIKKRIIQWISIFSYIKKNGSDGSVFLVI